MQTTEMIRCRVAACREALDDRNEWSFYLINDSAAALDSATLVEIGYRSNDTEFDITTNVSVTGIAPGANALIWRDHSSSGAEFLIDLRLRVRMREREARLRFEFPILNIQKYWTLVDGLGKLCWQETAEA